jgi:hypothetical protein
LPLPSASGYHGNIMLPRRHSHRGLPPHHIAPMLGAPLRSSGPARKAAQAAQLHVGRRNKSSFN